MKKVVSQMKDRNPICKSLILRSARGATEAIGNSNPNRCCTALTDCPGTCRNWSAKSLKARKVGQSRTAPMSSIIYIGSSWNSLVSMFSPVSKCAMEGSLPFSCVKMNFPSMSYSSKNNMKALRLKSNQLITKIRLKFMFAMYAQTNNGGLFKPQLLFKELYNSEWPKQPGITTFSTLGTNTLCWKPQDTSLLLFLSRNLFWGLLIAKWEVKIYTVFSI